MPASPSPHLALAIVSLVFSTSYVLTKIILREMSPATWAFYRLCLASLTLLPFVIQKKSWRAFREPRLWLCAVFGIALNQILFVEGLARTSPSHSALINATIPALTMVFSVLAGREHWRLSVALGIGCAISGVALLIGTPSGGELTGDLLTLANSASYSFYLVLCQPLARRYPALGLTGCFVMVGTVLSGLYAWLGSGQWEVGWAAWHHASLSTHMMMLFVAISSTTVAYSLNSWALGIAVPSQVAAYVTLQPIIATALSAAILSERLNPSFFPALVLVSAGVFLSARRK